MIDKMCMLEHVPRRTSESTVKLELEQATWDSTEAAAESWNLELELLSWRWADSDMGWELILSALQGIPIKT